MLDLCQSHGIPAEVRDISLPELYRADELFCTGTMGELTPVIELDGRTIGSAESNPVTHRLRQLYAEQTSIGGFPILAD